MVSNISSTASDSIQLMMAQMYQNMKAADTDGTAGLSQDELSSIDTSGDQSGAAFLQSLSRQFDALDADGDGQLSNSEISNAKPTIGPMGPPPGMTIAGSVESADSTSSTDSAKNLMQDLIDSFLKSFSDSFSKDNSKAMNDASNAAKSVLNSADVNGNAGVSLDELSSMVKNSDSKPSDFVSNLMKNFDSYDTNRDGQLSLNEMTDSIPKKQFSQQELASMSDKSQSAYNIGSLIGNLSGVFVQKLLNNYQNGGLSNLTSSLRVAG